jgi:hypothetical protein
MEMMPGAGMLEGMPAQNRVTPDGELVTTPMRGAWTGNRGILHDGRGIVRFHAGDLWITCALRFRGRYHQQWQPHHFTWLYFHDEAVSFAAGHRPCGECRRDAYVAYRDAWADALAVAPPSARQMNHQLHRQRIVPGTHTRRIRRIPWHELPEGAFVRVAEGPAVVVDDHLSLWTPTGYRTQLPRPHIGEADVITPPASLAVLRAGYPVQLDDAAR